MKKLNKVAMLLAAAFAVPMAANAQSVQRAQVPGQLQERA